LVSLLSPVDKSLICGEKVDSWYLFAWCKLRADYLQTLGRGATFAEISKPIVESITIPMPPLGWQQRFRPLVLLIEKSRRRSKASRSALEGLFQTLLHRAFTGDLTARWREAHMKELLAEMEAQARVLETAK
jgi:type I restriction enzyme S subunit